MLTHFDRTHRDSTAAILAGALVVATFGTLVSAGSAEAQRECWEDAIVAGALPEQPAPVFCTIDAQGPDTAISRPNRLRDTFDHGLSFADFEGTSYVVFDSVHDSVYDAIHWRHADHWMVDIAPVAPDSPFGPTQGASMMSPTGSYTFRNGRLAVEATFAAGHEDYLGTTAWGEIVITTAAEPTEKRKGGSTYGYEQFAHHYSLGCRLEPDRTPVCALMDDSEFGTIQGGRLWEMSFFQHVGETSRGGYPGAYDEELWRVCVAGVDPDTECRDHFRLELTATSVALFVNGKKYFEQTGIPPLPEELTDGPVYVYFASMLNRSDYEVIRYHWDGLAVNGRVPLPPEIELESEFDGDRNHAHGSHHEDREVLDRSRTQATPTAAATAVEQAFADVFAAKSPRRDRLD